MFLRLPLRLSLLRSLALRRPCALAVLALGVGGLLREPMRAVELPAVGTSAAEQQYFFDTFGTELGLPQTDIVLAIKQTRDGYLWLGTEGGLARFDGVRFVSFRASNTPAIRNNLVHCLHEARDGSLWIGTDRGVVRHREGRFERMFLHDVAVRSIAEDGTGRIWLGTAGQGLFSWKDGQLRGYSQELERFSRFIRTVFVDSTERVWVGFERQVGVVCHEADAFRYYDGDGAIEAEVGAVGESPRGTLWFGLAMEPGLYRLRGGELSFFSTADGLGGTRVYEVKAARGGGLWIAGDDLQKVEEGEAFSIRTIPQVPSEGVRNIEEDREGSIWLGARGAGVIRARPLPYRLISTEHGLPSAEVKTVAQDRAGNIWTGHNRLGVGKIAPDGTISLLPNFPRNPSSVYPARDGSLWVGIPADLHVWRHGQWQSFPEWQNVYGIFEDRKGIMWFGAASGLVRYDGRTFTPVDLGMGRTFTRASAFCEDAEGTVYVGTWHAGLLKIKEGEVTLFDRSNGLPADDVRAVFVDREGRLWVGFRSRGLALYEDGQWLNPHGLSEAVADHVSAITEDEHGRLWLGTSAGVLWASKADLVAAAREERPVPRLRVAEVATHAQPPATWSGAQPVVWKTEEGKLLFAMRRGVLVIDPDDLPRNRVPPPVRIETVVVDRDARPAASLVRAAPGTRDVTIDYTALSFIQSNRIVFEYQLEGYDASWVEAGTRRTAYYSHLPPGEFVFRVRASNVDGTWSEQPAEITIVQEPYFYQTTWFYALAAALAAAVVLGAHRWRTAALRSKNLKLNRVVRERTQELELANSALSARSRELELANSAKTEFLETVSHEIRNPLHGLTGLLGQLGQETLHPRTQSLMKSIRACALGLTRVFEEVLSYSKREYESLALRETDFSVRALLGEVVESFAWHAAQQGNRLRVEVAEDFADGFHGDEAKIKTVISNFVGNAIKYAPGSPVELRAEAHPMGNDQIEVHFEVCDHGPGIAAAEQELVFRKFVRGSKAKEESVVGTGLGLATCRVLARALDGSVGLDSEPGRGATFYLCVPLRRAPAAAGAPNGASRNGFVGTALIVEDEHYNQVVLRGIAHQLGYRADSASNVEQAFALLEEREYQVIFLDWELPGAKGGQVARQVRSRPGGDRPVILATTAHSSAHIRRECMEGGMDDFLQKPYDVERVRRGIAAVLARRHGSRNGEAVAREGVIAEVGLNLNALRLYRDETQADGADAVASYSNALEEELKAVQEALAENDRERLRAGAHRLRALAGLIGARELGATAEKLEMLAPEGSLAELRAARAALVSEAESLKHRLQTVPL